MSTRSKQLPRKLAELFEARMDRRLTLKLMAGTAVTGTLAACGVSPVPTLEPDTRTNTVILLGKVKDLTGRDRERLRAIASFLDPANRTDLDLLGEYWLASKPIIHAKPGQDFLGDGPDMIVIAQGNMATVQKWATQWAGVLDFDSDEAKSIGPLYPTRVASQGEGQAFLVFERRAGAIAPNVVLEAASTDVYIVSHHVLVNDRNRQVLVVRASSREAVHGWVRQWSSRHGVEVLELTHLSKQLMNCARGTTCPPPAVMAAGHVRPLDYHSTGQLVLQDQKLGEYYLRHQASGRFLTVAGGQVTTTSTPSSGDWWKFSVGIGLDGGKYYIQHEASGLYLNGDLQGHASASTSPQSWSSGLVANQAYGIMDDNGQVRAVLNADVNGVVSTVAPTTTNRSTARWEQWTDYNHPSAVEQKLHDIFVGTTHDLPWPEDTYTGDLLAAYNDIVTKLEGRKPKDGEVDTDLLNNAKTKVRQEHAGLLPAAYAMVFEHLDLELSHFHDAETWYGGNGVVGYVPGLLRDTTISNILIIETVQSLAKPPLQASAKFELSVLFTWLSLAVAAAEGGPVIGALIAGAWRIYSASTGGATDTLNSTFASLKDDLNRTFNSLITQHEDASSAIRGNWGKLSTFSGMITDGTLVWPKDTAGARSASARVFEVSVWQTVAESTWVISGSGLETDERPNESDILDSPWKYILQVPIQYKEPGKDPKPGWATDITYIPHDYVPDSLAQHLFDDASLGISMTDFYVGKNGWSIPIDMS